jgi:hypothetical protein
LRSHEVDANPCGNIQNIRGWYSGENSELYDDLESEDNFSESENMIDNGVPCRKLAYHRYQLEIRDVVKCPDFMGIFYKLHLPPLLRLHHRCNIER